MFGKHIENLTKVYGLNVVVAINRFITDSPEELEEVKNYAAQYGVKAVIADVWAKGGNGATELAQEVVRAAESDSEFKKKLSRAPYFCLPHYRKMLEYASAKMSKRIYPSFFDAVQKVNETYLDSLSSDVSHFCKKFDYRYDGEPWYNSKDSVQRSIKFLCGDPKEE